MKPKKGINVAVDVQPNPGPGKYIVIDIETGKVVFEEQFSKITSNVAQYLAIMHAIIKLDNPGVYTNSKIARDWILYSDKVGGTVCSKKDREMKARADNFLYDMLGKKRLPLVSMWKKEWGAMPAKEAL